MPFAILVSPLCLLFGGVFGAYAGNRLSTKLQLALPMAFSLATLAMAIVSLVKTHSLPAVILSLLLGTCVGTACDIEGLLKRLGEKAASYFMRVGPGDAGGKKQYLELFTIAVILFCTGPTGIYGSMQVSLSGDTSILMSKGVLDLFTAAIFGATLGMAVSALAIPVFAVFYFFYAAASLLGPWITPAMFADFSGCGGLLMLATGFRMAEIKIYHVADMLPALAIVMPVSYLWGLLPL